MWQGEAALYGRRADVVNEKKFYFFTMIALVLTLGYLCYLILRPFLTPLGWALVFSIVFFPVYKFLLRYVKWQSASAAITVILVAVLILGPFSYFAYLLAIELSNVSLKPIDVKGVTGVLNHPMIQPVLKKILSFTQVSQTQLQASLVATFSGIGKKMLEYLPGRLSDLAGAALHFGLMMFAFMRQGSSQPGGGNVFSFGKSRARRITADQPTVHFTDVAGVEEAKEELAEVVEFLKSPEKFAAVGARIPRGILLVGPPGTGKTLMARAVAGEASVPFFHISGSEFVELFVGVGASRVRDLFEEAKKAAPCIIFIDEIDAVGRQRGRGLGGGNDEREQTLNQILVEMDGFDKNLGIVVIAATNRPDILDTALLRPGRFDRRVTLDSPDLAGRLAILQVHARGKPLAPGADLTKLAKQTPGFSGADLENILNEAAILTARRKDTVITESDLEEAVDRVIAGPEKKGRLISPEEKEITAYHEVGHALVAYYMPHLDPIHKVTVVARGHSGGQTRLLPSGDRHLWTRSQMSEMLAFAMGGLSAEELMFGEGSTGPSNDLHQATSIARKMVTTYGMSEKIGTVSLDNNGVVDYMGADILEPRTYSEETAALVDAEIRRLIEESHARARQVLSEHRDEMVMISEILKEKETVTGEEMDRLIKERRSVAA